MRLFPVETALNGVGDGENGGGATMEGTETVLIWVFWGEHPGRVK